MSTNKLILAGAQLSNICYNIKQDSSLPQHVRDSMERCVKEWDDAVREHVDNKKRIAIWKQENL